MEYSKDEDDDDNNSQHSISRLLWVDVLCCFGTGTIVPEAQTQHKDTRPHQPLSHRYPTEVIQKTIYVLSNVFNFSHPLDWTNGGGPLLLPAVRWCALCCALVPSFDPIAYWIICTAAYAAASALHHWSRANNSKLYGYSLMFTSCWMLMIC